ncbi:hypothetical protein [Streptomyces sp. SID13031]|uniref:hypothetical protein n=1 Tax=Streptomyces sp. SID13031 TaxID=2706046 RepID=UPI0013C78924|nr:hypothetical protein [Streptomyces sp. SID13031]NEA37351.1 hypothetical protein [Streptomyces sp. SID13031]
MHHELVSPTDGSAVRAHGWIAIFPAVGPPVHRRFGPAGWSTSESAIFTAGPVEVTGSRLAGSADEATWDLRMTQHGPPLFTFPAWAWHRGILPAAQIVPCPAASYSGIVRYGGQELTVVDALGANARIYGHGNAQRWAWLHADLGDGNLIEVVAAVSGRPGLRHLRPLPLVRLRLDGEDYPRGDTLLAARRLRAEFSTLDWRVHGRIGHHMINVEVHQPVEQTVTVSYLDPDGTQKICRNSERATADITWTTANGKTERRWRIDSTAHAEVGGLA